MAKKCVIYYATVVESEYTWNRKGSVSIEPVQVWGEEPLGKVPEFCCTELKDAREYHLVTAGGAGFYYREALDKKVNFCPFCGAKIVFKEHLKLKVIETPITRNEYHYEEVK